MKRSARLFGTLLTAGVMLVGCEKSETGGDAMKSLTDAANKASDSASSAVESAASAAGDMANQAMDSVIKPLQTQLGEYAGKIDTLKEQAAKLTNTDLSSLVDQASAKYTEIKGKIDAAMKGDTSAIEMLKTDGSKMMSELKGLYDQAMAKMGSLMPTGG